MTEFVGVVGAGTIGTGVAQSIAQARIDVMLIDRSDAALERARHTIRRNCRMSAMLGGPSLDPDEVLSRVRTGFSFGDLVHAELVIENVTEDESIKLDVYRALDRTCFQDTVFIANTSCFPITRIASWMSARRAPKVIGVHFMNPVPRQRCVELIPGRLTSPDTIDATHGFLSLIGKEPIEVRDAVGFGFNRVLMTTINEAAFVVYEGTADAATVDREFREFAGHPMGPLATANLIGIRTIVNSIRVLWTELGDKYRVCPLLAAMADAGETFDVR